MLHPRSGHSSAKIVLDREEKVLVVGGWDKRGVCQATTEIHSIKDDIWESLPSLPTPRVDFTLKVVDLVVTAIGGYYGPDDSRVFPKVAVMTWSRDKGWGPWQQKKGQEQEFKRKSGFM